MTTLITTLTTIAVAILLASGAFAQGPSPAHSPSPFVAIPNEPAPKLFVDAPVPGPLARGAVLIPYRVENFRILPVLGAGAVTLSPRIGHLDVTVDDLPWHWGDFVTTRPSSWSGCRPARTRC
jgi:hypothetical protein